MRALNPCMANPGCPQSACRGRGDTIAPPLSYPSAMWQCSFLSLDVPSLPSLTLLKWRDKYGQRQTLRLIEELSPQWETVGTLLGIGSPILDNLRSSQADNIGSCRRVFKDWIAKEGHPGYPVSWDGVCELLCDVQKPKLAKKLKESLNSTP